MIKNIQNTADWVPEYEGKIGAIEHNTRGWDRFHRPPGVRLLIELEKNGKPGLVLNFEHREEHGVRDYRMPGGKVFNSWNEYKQFLDSNPTRDEWEWEYISKANFEGRQEAGVEQSDSQLYHIQKAGGTVKWDLACIRMNNVRLADQELEEGEDIERVHLDIDEVENILRQRDSGGDYLVKEATSRAELLMWLLENKYWKNSSL